MANTDYLFLRACRGEAVERTPVWIMRQAGRYLKEYRQVRARAGSFLNLCRTPELAAEVTLQPVDIVGVDAAIIFSDILVLVEAMGVPLEFAENTGPILEFTIKDQAAVDALGIPDPVDDIPYLLEAIRMVRNQLKGRVPLIGFSGAPFTLASYMIEGRTSKQFIEIKTMMFHQPLVTHNLLEKLAEAITVYLRAQIDAGAQAVQIFDSWAGTLSPRDFAEFAMPYVKQVVEGVRASGVPVIYFAQGNPALLELAASTGADVIGLDWRIELGKARDILGDAISVQGNLDPCALFMPIEGIRARVKEIVDQNAGRRGHIFNLGHGILPPTPVESAKALVEAVREFSGA